MLRVPTSRERRTILVASALALLVLTPTRLVPHWRAYRAERGAAAMELAAELARAEAGVAALPSLRDSLVVFRERYLALAPLLLVGKSPSAAGAALASLLSGSAQSSELRVGAIRIRSDSISASGFVRVRAEAELTGDIHGLTALLLALERGPALLRVRQLAVTQPDPGAPGDRPEMLRVELVVEGIAIVRTEEAAR